MDTNYTLFRCRMPHFLLVGCCLFFTHLLSAQTITIGNGIGANSSTDYPAPYGNSYKGARHQFLYRKAEIQAAGGVNGAITQFGFNVIAANMVDPLGGFTIKMGQTSSDSLLTYQSGLTTVYSANSYTPVNGWNMSMLAPAFTLDTSLNLVVEVCFSNISTSENASTEWTTGLPAYTSVYTYSNTAVNGCADNSTAPNYATTLRPNARFVINTAAPMTYTTTLLSQHNSLPLKPNGVNQEIMRIDVVTNGNTNPLVLTHINLATAGTSTPADITNASIFYTAQHPVFDTNVLFGKLSNPGAAPLSITGNQTLLPDTNYFWLAYSISPSAPIGATFDAQVDSIRVSGISHTVSPVSVAGSRSLMGPMAGAYPVGTGHVLSNLQTAITHVLNRGISANVELVLNDTADTLYRTLSIDIFANPSVDTLVIRPLNTCRISGKVAGPLIDVRASHVIINGSNSAAGISRDLTIENIETSGSQAIRLAPQSGMSLYNCAVLNCNLINGSRTFESDAGILIGNISNPTDQYRDILVRNNRLQKSFTGIAAYSMGGITRDIIIDSNDINTQGSDQICALGILLSGVSKARIANNHIGNFRTNTDIIKAGIAIGNQASDIIVERNHISNVGSTDALCAVAGIRISDAISTVVRNNFVDSIYSSGYPYFDVMYNPSGIYVNSARGISIVHNTIKMSGNTLIGSDANSAGVRIEGTSFVDLRNNYIHNTLGLAGNGTSGFGAFAVTMQYDYPGFGGFSDIKTNNYYVGASSGINAIGRVTMNMRSSNNNYLTLRDWMRAFPQDSGSFSENTPFVSPTDLHIPAGTHSSMKGGAVVVNGVTTDYDLDIRNSTKPDIGADEFSGFYLDRVVPDISYSPLRNHSSLSGRMVNDVNITDFSGVNVTPGFAPRLYFKRTGDNNAFAGNTASDNGWKFVESPSSSSPFSFNIDYYLLYGGGSVNIGDTIQYFIVAEDSASLHNTGSFPSEAFYGTSVDTILSAPSAPYSYLITQTPLAGTYDVGSSYTYQTLTAAVNDMNLRGVSAPVTFNLMDADYSVNETFPIVIKNIDGASASNAIVIKPSNVVASVRISGNTSSSVIRLEDSRYITINGSANGTASRDLSINNTGLGSVIHFASLGEGKGCMNDSIINTVISSNRIDADGVYGIFMGGTVLGSAGSNHANITISNDSISYVGKAICATGVNKISGLVITDNVIGHVDFSKSVFSRGIEVTNASGLVINRNEIINVKSTATTEGGPVAIRLYGTDAPQITKNKITGVAYTGNGGYGAKGIVLFFDNTNALIENNFIADVYSDCYTAASIDKSQRNNIGILVRTGSGHKLRNNSIWMSGNRAANSYPDALSAGIFIRDALTNLDVRNNLVLNTQTSSNASKGSNYGIYSQTDASGFTFLNHNNYYVSSDTPGVNNFVGFINGASQPTLAAWKAATGKEAASNNDSIQYVSLTDLHLTGSSIGNLHFTGEAISGVTTDIDDDVRHVFPYMGADENTGSPLPVELLDFTARRQGEKALLSWATASETNHAYFIIERSTDARVFSYAGRVNGNGNSKGITNYLFADETASGFAKAASGNVYYRLAQVDVNGDITYSSNVCVVFSNTLPALTVYPNPVRSDLIIDGPTKEELLVSISDIRGRELLNTKESSLAEGKHRIDMSAFESGIYFVKIMVNGTTSTHKVIKQ